MFCGSFSNHNRAPRTLLILLIKSAETNSERRVFHFIHSFVELTLNDDSFFFRDVHQRDGKNDSVDERFDGNVNHFRNASGQLIRHFDLLCY